MSSFFCTDKLRIKYVLKNITNVVYVLKIVSVHIYMKKFFAIFVFSLAIISESFASGYDFTALFNPANYKNVDTIYRNPQGKQVFGIAFESMSIAMGTTAFNIKIPQKVIINKLSLTVQAVNLTQDELNKLEFPRPLSFEINQLNLVIYGKKRVLTLKASQAKVFKENTIYLSDDSHLTIGDKSTNLGKGATISLKGRILTIKTQELGELSLKI